MQVSLWEKESFYKPSDVLIIGAGFAGLWTALVLKKKRPTLDIVIIDKGIIPTGASTRNAGFSCFGSVTELVYDAKTFGEEKMLTLAAQRYAGLKLIREIFKSKTIDYDPCGGYELFTQKGNYDLSHLKSDLKKLNKSLKKIFKEDDIFNLADKKIGKFGFAGITHLVENRLEGCLHSGKLSQALLREVQLSGVRVLFGLEATSYEKMNGGVLVQTAQQIELQTNKLVVCTNAFNSLLPGVTVNPARGQVLVTSPIPGLPFKGSFHYDEGFVYFRNVGKRVLLGGARNKFFDEENTHDLSTTDNVQGELERLLSGMILPKVTGYSIDYRWSGIMGMGTDKMPTVEEIKPGVFCAVALGGIGVAMAPVVALQVTRMVLEKRKVSAQH
ncbi:MAG TPA: FAD-dependent oxidoreductase [Chitinophagaceae bacterium]